MKFPLLLLCWILLLPAGVRAKASLRVAVAANFINAMEHITAEFTQKHGITVQASYGSSGKLYAQMKNGAPYDLLLSADSKRPTFLYKAGVCAEPFLYASGSVVLWSMDNNIAADSWPQALTANPGKIAIANPETAPYGEAARNILEEKKLYGQLSSRLVFGQSVGQTFLFARTGGAKFGFISLSQAMSEQGRNGKFWRIAEAAPVSQWGCVSATPTAGKEAGKFQEFLNTPKVKNIIRAHGYLPNEF